MTYEDYYKQEVASARIYQDKVEHKELKWSFIVGGFCTILFLNVQFLSIPQEYKSSAYWESKVASFMPQQLISIEKDDELKYSKRDLQNMVYKILGDLNVSVETETLPQSVVTLSYNNTKSFY